MKSTGFIIRLMMLFIAAGAVLVISSCRGTGHIRNGKDAALVVGNIKFEGNKRFKRAELLTYMQTNKSSWQRRIGLAETQYLVKGRLKDDLKTLTELYRSAGYYDTKIENTKIETKREHSRRILITITVEEGEPILVTSLDIVWKGDIENRSGFEKKILMHKGSPADMTLLSSSKERLLADLKDEGYALATVEESMEVDLEKKSAAVRFEITPGPLCRVGGFSISGLKRVRRDLVERDLKPYKGERYTPAVKKQIEDSLLSMNVFSVVSVYPENHLSPDGALTIHIALSEGEFQALKLGVGVALEPNMQKVFGTSVYSHQNLLGRLLKFQMRTDFGYAFLPYFWQIDTHGPIALVEPSLSKKGLLERELFWTLTTSFRSDVDEDYKYLGPKVRLSMSRFLFKRTAASLSYNFEYNYIYNASDRWTAAIQDVYPAFQNPARLGYVELSYRAMFTDSISEPKNGAVLEVRYAIAAKALASIERYNKVAPSVSFYWQMFSRLQLALRTETGFIFPFGGTDDTQPWSNFFLGGYNTMRGWGGKKLAPSVKFCVTKTDCDTLRIGGRTMVLGNVELRIRTVEKLYVVTFLDVGDVQYDIWTILPKEWNYSVGAGLRFDTPVGKVRFDVAFRLNNPTQYENEPRLGIHIGLGEAF